MPCISRLSRAVKLVKYFKAYKQKLRAKSKAMALASLVSFQKQKQSQKH
jgi:hypothetical protein